MAALLTVKHNIEVAHRLVDTPGKCENIHGHSMWVELSIRGRVDPSGKLNGLDFGEVKARFRQYLDSSFDHQLLLNVSDPWFKLIMSAGKTAGVQIARMSPPGARTFPGDPTTENIAAYIYRWVKTQNDWIGEGTESPVYVTVYETAVNSATYGDF